MEIITQLIFSIILLPIVVGYVYGRKQVDPNTAHGKIYYSQGD